MSFEYPSLHLILSTLERHITTTPCHINKHRLPKSLVRPNCVCATTVQSVLWKILYSQSESVAKDNPHRFNSSSFWYTTQIKLHHSANNLASAQNTHLSSSLIFITSSNHVLSLSCSSNIIKKMVNTDKSSPQVMVALSWKDLIEKSKHPSLFLHSKKSQWWL